MKEKFGTVDAIKPHETIAPAGRRKIKSLTVIHGHVAPGVLKSNDNISEASHEGIEMYLDNGFIDVNYKGNAAGIPLANIKGWVFE